MVRYYKKSREIEPINTTISAICVLNKVSVGQRRFGIRIAKYERETGKELSIDKCWKMAHEAEETEVDFFINRLRVVVYENPYAIAPLAEVFGTGPLDERYSYSIREGCFSRVFVGSLLETLEAEERAAGVKQ